MSTPSSTSAAVYSADERQQWRRTLLPIVVSLLAAAGLVGLGVALPEDSYLLLTLFLLFLYATQSLAWNLIGGFAGQTSFGHATFFGIGAYATALLQQEAGWPALPALVLGGLLAAGFSVLWGYPLFRLRGFYFAIATIGINEATRLIALTPLQEVTGGASGYRLDTVFASGRFEQYVSALALLLAAVLFSAWVSRSPLGLGLFALNMDGEAAETLGVPTARLKAIALALSAFLVGMTGGIYVRAFLYINPNDVFAFSTSIAIVLMTVIGGLGTLTGPILGAIVYVVIQDQLGAMRLVLGERTFEFRDLQLGLYGLLLASIVLFEPAGLVGALRRLRRLRRRRPRGSPSPAAATQQDGEDL